MCKETLSVEMEALADALEQSAQAYRNVAESEMRYGGSMDQVYNCVRNSRNLGNKSRRVRQFGATY